MALMGVKPTKEQFEKLILQASACPPKVKDTSDFRQVWFTRNEVERVLELSVLALAENPNRSKIENVRDNLIRTIAGKEELLRTEYDIRQRNFLNNEDDAAFVATREFLRINISELKRILSDVELCIS
jgi:hypothetical protein